VEVTIDLKTIDKIDLPTLLAWRNDWRLIQFTRQWDLINEVEHQDWFDRQARDPATRMYKIMFKCGDAEGPVGVCGLTSIDYRNSRAEFSLYIIPEFKRRGIGKNALSLLLKHAFLNMGLNLVWGETFDENPAIPMFESLGMVKEGTRRAFYFKEGKRIAAHLYSITREEWNASILAVPASRSDAPD